MQNDPYSFSQIINGQYHVTINLAARMRREEIDDFEKNYWAICREDAAFARVCSFQNPIFRYRSESLFPPVDKIDLEKNSKKDKVMVILGNPATNSVDKKMFFYSRGEKGDRHQFWGKLKTAELMKGLDKNIKDRDTEANMRRDAIIRGDTSDQYLLGLTTFYSIPTPVKPGNREEMKQYPAKTKYGNAEGVENLFKSALQRLQEMEYNRLNSYDFAKGAIWIFTQKSSYKYVQSLHESAQIEYWPMFDRKSGKSGGAYLREILRILIRKWKDGHIEG